MVSASLSNLAIIWILQQGIDLVMGRGEELPLFDFHAPLLSLPSQRLCRLPNRRSLTPAQNVGKAPCTLGKAGQYYRPSFIGGCRY
jgi:hypothetical protein